MKFLKDSTRVFAFCTCIILHTISTGYGIEITQDMKSLVRKLHDRCQKQTGVSEDLLRQSHSGEIPNDPALKCYFHCIFDIVGLIDANNIIHLHFLLDVLPPEVHKVVQTLAEKCGTQPGSDSCDVVYQTLKCYNKVDKISLMLAISILLD